MLEDLERLCQRATPFGEGVLVGQQPADLLGVQAVRASALRRRQLPQSQSDHPQVVFARLGSSAWEGAYDARTAGVPVSKHRAAMRVTWVIDASVGCALGTWTGALADDGLPWPGACVCSPPSNSDTLTRAGTSNDRRS